jgi:hypothetical protein
MELFSWLAGSVVVRPGTGRHFTPGEDGSFPLGWGRSSKATDKIHRVRRRSLMTDQQLALQAMSDAQRILEEYLEPRPHNNERILDKLVEVLERPDVLVAVDRLQRGGW